MVDKSFITELTSLQLECVLEKFDFDNKFINYIKYPKNEIIVNFPVELDDGSYQIFKGYRIQHNNLLGPYKGGLRYHQDVYLNECKALAFWMMIKCALQELPLGGGKGGIKFNPRDFSSNDLNKISRAFTKALYKYIGPQKDIPAPDVGTNSQIMDWMTAEYQRINKTHIYGCFTGKSLNFNGSLGRTEATGRGVFVCIREWFKYKSINPSGKTYILQGFGNVGSNLALLLSQIGMVCIGVGDHTGYWKNDDGIDINSLNKYVKVHKQIKGFENIGNQISVDDFFKLKCNVIVPAALELQINGEVAKNINCDLIVEGANGPTDHIADVILESKNIDVLPDIFANSGGVMVSYFEWIQNKQDNYWTLDEINKKLESKMVGTFNKLNEIKERHLCSYRTAAYFLALKRLEYFYNIKKN